MFHSARFSTYGVTQLNFSMQTFKIYCKVLFCYEKGNPVFIKIILFNINIDIRKEQIKYTGIQLEANKLTGIQLKKKLLDELLSSLKIKKIK